MSKGDNIKVAVRIRPLNTAETQRNSRLSVWATSEDEILIDCQENPTSKESMSRMSDLKVRNQFDLDSKS